MAKFSQEACSTDAGLVFKTWQFPFNCRGLLYEGLCLHTQKKYCAELTAVPQPVFKRFPFSPPPNTMCNHYLKALKSCLRLKRVQQICTISVAGENTRFLKKWFKMYQISAINTALTCVSLRTVWVEYVVFYHLAIHSNL